MAILCIVCEIYSHSLVENREIFIPHLYLATRWNLVKMFNAGKTWIIGLPYGEKLWRYVKPFSSDTRTSRRDGQTDLLYQYRASVCWRAIKINGSVECKSHVVNDKIAIDNYWPSRAWQPDNTTTVSPAINNIHSCVAPPCISGSRLWQVMLLKNTQKQHIFPYSGLPWALPPRALHF